MKSVCGGRGGCPLQARYVKGGGGGGGFVHFRLNMKSGGLSTSSSIWKVCLGEGCCPLQTPYEKLGDRLSTSSSI